MEEYIKEFAECKAKLTVIIRYAKEIKTMQQNDLDNDKNYADIYLKNLVKYILEQE